MGSGQGDVQYHELGFLEVYVWTMKEGIRRYGRSINVFGHMIVGRSMVLINFCAILQFPGLFLILDWLTMVLSRSIHEIYKMVNVLRVGRF